MELYGGEEWEENSARHDCYSRHHRRRISYIFSETSIAFLRVFNFELFMLFFFFLKSERDDWDVKVLKMPLLNSCMICTFGNWYSWEISTYQRGKVFFFLEIGTDASVIKIKYRLLMRQLRMRIKIFLSWKEPRWWWNFFNVWAFNIHFVNSKVSMVYLMNYFFFFFLIYNKLSGNRMMIFMICQKISFIRTLF